MGQVDGMGCQHFQVMLTQLLQKHWSGRTEGKTLGMEASQRPTSYIASLDTRTAFWRGKTDTCCENYGRARHLGGSTQLLSRRSANVEGHACFENDGQFKFTRCIRPGSDEAPTLWVQLEEKRRRIHFVEIRGKSRQICRILWADNYRVLSHAKEHLQQLAKDVTDEADVWDLEPKSASLRWSNTSAAKIKKDTTTEKMHEVLF